ncbi:MAG: class I SAM-dependent methyltransferase, partial [Bdellovibrionales bacterium]|nr:class I SAM-dependent methyltransferase [Bdellovibrionales bacterium]
MLTVNLLQKLEKAVLRRLELRKQTEPVRWIDDNGDGFPGLVVDGYGDLGMLHARSLKREIESSLVEIAKYFVDQKIFRSVYLRRRREGAECTAKEPAELVFGDPVREIWVREGALEFLIRPEDQVNSGLFIDMRDLRGWLLRESLGFKVLNLFCFTGTLGVAALNGGAQEVVQVDISKRALRWAQENFERNRREGAQMRVIAEDCRAFVARELRRVKKGLRPYDLVILDPPVFGRSAGKPFRLGEEVAGLVGASLELLTRTGTL